MSATIENNLRNITSAKNSVIPSTETKKKHKSKSHQTKVNPVNTVNSKNPELNSQTDQTVYSKAFEVFKVLACACSFVVSARLVPTAWTAGAVLLGYGVTAAIKQSESPLLNRFVDTRKATCRMDVIRLVGAAAVAVFYTPIAATGAALFAGNLVYRHFYGSPKI